MIMNKIQELYIHLFQIDNLVAIRNFSKKSYLFKTINLEFQVIELWFTDQNSYTLEIEDRINLTLVIK